MSVTDLNEYKNKQKQPKYTSEPKQGQNMYKKNLVQKIEYFNKSVKPFKNNTYIELCDFSIEGCAIKFLSKINKTVVVLILQDYSPEEYDSQFATWEFYIQNTEKDEYLDSRFFSSSSMAIKYFISKVKYLCE